MLGTHSRNPVSGTSNAARFRLGSGLAGRVGIPSGLVIMDAVAHTIRAQAWQQAETLGSGRGLEAGGDLTAPRKWEAQARAQGRHDLAGAGEGVVAGVQWTRERIARTRLDYDIICRRCNSGDIETLAYRHGTCRTIASCKARR